MSELRFDAIVLPWFRLDANCAMLMFPKNLDSPPSRDQRPIETAPLPFGRIPPLEKNAHRATIAP